MFERFWVKEEREKHFVACFLLSFVFVFLSIIISYHFVPFQIQGRSLSGIISVLLASLVASYPLIRYLEKRETDEEKSKNLKEMHLLERHWTELEIYLAFFLGTALSFALSKSLFPNNSFHTQTKVIESISGRLISVGLFQEIIMNNLSVFFITFLLSFLLTAGMVFILVWNASVLGVFLADISKGLAHLPFVAVSYLPHGILEISGYTLAGISGFFLSHESQELFEWKDKGRAIQMIKDSVFLLFLGFVLLVIAGLLETLSL